MSTITERNFKNVLIVLIILLPLIFSSLSEGNVSVQPPEVSISMNEDFINGNTSTKITLTNNNEHDVNTTWYAEHPNPISWMRPNRTCMVNLSWIDVKPQWHVIHPNSTATFYIYLNIPEHDELLDQHWETWITFKLGKQESSGSIFNQEYAVRVYIDTPKKAGIEDISDYSNISDYNLYFILAAAIPLTLLLIMVWSYKKKK